MSTVTVSNPRKAGRVIMLDGGASIHIPAGESREVDLTADQIEGEKVAGLEISGEGKAKARPEPETKSDNEGDRFDDMSDDELRAFLEKETGDKPHWNAKRETLLEKARAV